MKTTNHRFTTGLSLYYHRTDGGAEYLTDRFILCQDGHKEGIFKGATIIIRLDGGPEIMHWEGGEE